MVSTNSDKSEDFRELDLLDLAKSFWADRFLIGSSGLLLGLLGVAIAISQQDVYQSNAVLIDKSSVAGTSSLSRLGSQITALSGIGGLNLGGMSASTGRPMIAIKTIQGRDFFAEELYERVLVDLVAVKSWDKKSNMLQYDSNLVELGNLNWRKDDESGELQKPSVQRAHEMFLEQLLIEEDEQGFVTLQIEHISPHVAKSWVELVVEKINSRMRQQDVDDAQAAIDFLSNKLQQTKVVNLNVIYSQLLEEQMKTLTLAFSSPEYVFKIIEGPVASEIKERPKRAQTSILFGVSGIFLGLFLSAIRLVNRLRGSKEARLS